MQVTILEVPCNGARVTTPLNTLPTLDLLTAAVGSGNVKIVPGFDTIEYEGEVVPLRPLFPVRPHVHLLAAAFAALHLPYNRSVYRGCLLQPGRGVVRT
jgi:hypothetical protein